MLAGGSSCHQKACEQFTIKIYGIKRRATHFLMVAKASALLVPLEACG